MTNPTFFVDSLLAWDRVAQIYLSSPKTDAPEALEGGSKNVPYYEVVYTDRMKDEIYGSGTEKYSSFIDRFRLLAMNQGIGI